MRNYIMMTVGVAFLMGNPHIKAQQLGLEYDAELQCNFKGDYNWVNLLSLNGSLNVSKHFSLEAITISIAKTNDVPIIDDLQGFSNIEEDNMPLGIAVLGVEYRNRRSSFFLGIRNVNVDFFTSPVTSLFINSSCGIFPTISGNYNIANYPLSSWCFHYKVEWDKIMLQTSLYEGLGHRRITGYDNVFSFSPARNGMFSISSVEYDNNGSNYSLGCALYYGVHNGNEDAIEAAQATTSKKMTVAPWVNAEQRLTDAWSALFQASFSTSKEYCRYYFGIGSSYKLGRATMGIFADYAKYSMCSEIATELTCHIPVTSIISLQPAIETICTDSRTNVVGIIRLNISL